MYLPPSNTPLLLVIGSADSSISGKADRMSGLGNFPDVSIIDIRRENFEDSLVKDLLNGLNPGVGHEKALPTLLLYDETGLKLFEQITYLEEYYLTNAEIEVLNMHADKIAERIPAQSLLVELGSGYGNLGHKAELLFIPRDTWRSNLIDLQKSTQGRDPSQSIRACRKGCRVLCP
jgi:hypothetical protein